MDTVSSGTAGTEGGSKERATMAVVWVAMAVALSRRRAVSGRPDGDAL